MIRKLILPVLAAGLLAGCKKSENPAGAGAAPQMPPVSVVAVEAKRQPVSENLSLVGTVAADEMVDIRAEVDGTVQDVKFEEGKPVEKGQLLIQLDPTKLAASLAEAEAGFKLSEANFERMKQLLKGNLIAQQEYDQASSVYEVNRATLDRKRRELLDTKVFAPFKGVAGSRLVSPGQVISKDTRLTSVVALDPVKIEVNVPERFLGEVQSRQKIEVTVAAYPGEKFLGDVFFVAPQLDSVMRTALVKARIPNADFRLKPGMFANLDLTLKVRENAVVIPESALILNGDNVLVFIVDDKKTAQMRPVKTGMRLSGQVEITEGLQGGELVIVEGHQKTQPGGPVIIAGAAQPPPQAATTAPKK